MHLSTEMFITLSICQCLLPWWTPLINVLTLRMITGHDYLGSIETLVLIRCYEIAWISYGAIKITNTSCKKINICEHSTNYEVHNINEKKTDPYYAFMGDVFNSTMLLQLIFKMPGLNIIPILECFGWTYWSCLYIGYVFLSDFFQTYGSLLLLLHGWNMQSILWSVNVLIFLWFKEWYTGTITHNVQ